MIPEWMRQAAENRAGSDLLGLAIALRVQGTPCEKAGGHAAAQRSIAGRKHLGQSPHLRTSFNAKRALRAYDIGDDVST